MELTSIEKQFLIRNRNLIEKDDYESLIYISGASGSGESNFNRVTICKFLYFECGIDILKYLDHIPMYLYVAYQDSTEVVLQDKYNIVDVNMNAFFRCENLELIDLRQTSISNIHFEAFAYCPNLKTVLLPDSVTTIDSTAFLNSPNVTVFCTKGSLTWNKLKKIKSPKNNINIKDIRNYV